MSLCFSPALSLPFAHHDNVRFFDKFYDPHPAGPERRDPQYAMAYLLGRPLTAEIHQIIYTHVSQIADLKIIRWLTVIIFALSAGILANIFCTFGLSDLESLCLSVALFILPGVQDAIIMLAIQNALAVWLVLWAYLASCRGYVKDKLFVEALIIFSLILASMLLYPQWSFFFFVPVMVKLLIAPSRDARVIHGEILRLVLFFIGTAVFYYFYIKIFVSYNNARAGSYAFTIDLNFLYWKTIAVFSKVLPMSFNFWNFHTNPWLGWAMMGLTMILLRKRAIPCFLMMAATTSFWLLVRTDVILHRIFFVTAVMALASFLIGARNRYFIVGMMTLGLLTVHHLTYDNARNYYLESAFIQQRLMAHKGDFSRVHIVLARPNGKGYNGKATVDDIFNARTASYSFNTDTLNLLKGVLKNMDLPDSWKVYPCDGDQQKCVEQNPVGKSLLVTHSSKGQQVYNSPGMVLIDFNDL